MIFPETVSQAQILISEYLQRPNHYAFAGYSFDTCNSFDEYCFDDNEVSFDEKTMLYTYGNRTYTRSTIFDYLPYKYMLLNHEFLFDIDFRTGANFLTALADVLDIEDYEKNYVVANALLEKQCPMFLKFKKFPRNIEHYPIIQSSFITASKLYNALPDMARHDLEKVFSEEDRLYRPCY